MEEENGSSPAIKHVSSEETINLDVSERTLLLSRIDDLARQTESLKTLVEGTKRGVMWTEIGIVVAILISIVSHYTVII